MEKLSLKIVSYRELSDEEKESLLPIMRIPFGWPFNPQKFEEMAKIDPCYWDSPIGFCAVENGKVVSFVGVMNLRTRNLDGEVEIVGGIYGVSTLPSHARKGISTMLMEKAHEYLREKAYRFSFLTTSKAIVAYHLYQKLGYKDATEFPSVQKITKGRGVEGKEKSKEKALVNWNKILEIYNKFTKDKTGFVIRDKQRLKLLRKYYGIKPEMILQTEKAYCIFKQREDPIYPSTQIMEIASLKTGDAINLIRRVEERAESVVYDHVVLDNKILKAYEALGYMIEHRSYDVLMVKELADTSFEEAYGEKFYISILDFF
ncbi:hypothetical protein DRO54_04395 [Candidatus Bathyarchaeota archaeon]|nr:MAG: hypothetical protein DRO54_04395 [Candidatus Bathyarchaeota archaeon]